MLPRSYLLAAWYYSITFALIRPRAETLTPLASAQLRTAFASMSLGGAWLRCPSPTLPTATGSTEGSGDEMNGASTLRWSAACSWLRSIWYCFAWRELPDFVVRVVLHLVDLVLDRRPWM